MKNESIKLSKNEGIKKKSRGLRGTLKESLVNKVTGALFEEDQDLIKFHGIYGQDDRDRRSEREEKKLERLYSYMIRLRIPGGLIYSETWRKIHEIANQYSTGIIKITTRQTVQLHGIIKSKLRPTLSSFDLAGLDSIAACGDVNRNVICSANPALSPLFDKFQALADKISLLLLPKTRAYYEIWLDKESILEREEEDPLYQDHYLPRKFKIAIAVPPSNDVDIYANDIGIIPVIENTTFLGYNITVGGGLGTTHGNPSTYPRLGSDLGFVSSEQDLLKVVYEIVTVQRDYGNRSDRKQARLKYTLDKLGMEEFQKILYSRTKIVLQKSHSISFASREDDYGWVKDSKGLWYYTAFIENGRVLDSDSLKIKSGLYEIAKEFSISFRFTANQHLILGDIPQKHKSRIHQLLEEYGIEQSTQNASGVRRNSMACVALPTCPLALAEAQRYLPTFLDKVEELIKQNHLDKEKINIRMTGCPNGCARPYLAEIGLIGTSLGHYNLYLGGSTLGNRLNRLYKENLDESAILYELDKAFKDFHSLAFKGESFGDFWDRTENLIHEN